MLLSNGVRLGSNPGKLYAFTNALTTDWGIYTDKGNWNKTGSLRSFPAGEAAVAGLTMYASRPSGNTHPVAWVLAQKPGRISSRVNCFLTIGFSGHGELGRNLAATTVITIDADAIGKLVMAGSGEAIITIDSTGAIYATMGSPGLAAIEIGAVADLNSLGWLLATGTMGITGMLQSYGIGWMEGTTAEGGLTPGGIASAVWDELQAGHTASGSFGALVDFIHRIEGGRWKIISNQMIFYASDNVTEVARFNLYDAEGNPAITDVAERTRA